MKILIIDWANALDVVGFGLGMVFVLLILLVFVLSLFSKAIAPTVKIPVIRKKKSDLQSSEIIENEYTEEHLSANVSAAIAMALSLYYSVEHDEESDIITIKTVEKRYSPWSSKIYGINNLIK